MNFSVLKSNAVEDFAVVIAVNFDVESDQVKHLQSNGLRTFGNVPYRVKISGKPCAELVLKYRV